MGPVYGSAFDMFDVVEILFPLFFVVVLGFIVFVAVKGVSQWSRNNASPVLSVEARVVAKRSDTSTSFHGGAGDPHHMHHHTASTTSTSYYATFEVESGDRLEFYLSGDEYGMLAEGDQGRLTFQGTRYRGFQRH